MRNSNFLNLVRNRFQADIAELDRKRGWFIGLGIFLIVLGFLAGGAGFRFVADEEHLADGRISFEGLFDAFDDDCATVVATHDIHCNSHR